MHGIGGVHHIPNPCMYSGHFGDIKEKYLEQFDDVIDLNIGKNGLAGFWAGESFILCAIFMNDLIRQTFRTVTRCWRRQ